MRQRAFAAIVSCVCVWRSVHVRGLVFFRAGCLVCVRVYTYAWVPAGSLLFFYPVRVVTYNVFGSSRPKTRNRGCCWGEKKKKFYALHFVVCKTCPLSYQYFFPSCTIVCTRVFLNGIRLGKSQGGHRLRWQERGRRGVIDIGVSARSSVCKLFVPRLSAHITLKTRTVSCDMTSSQDFSCD